MFFSQYCRGWKYSLVFIFVVFVGKERKTKIKTTENAFVSSRRFCEWKNHVKTPSRSWDNWKNVWGHILTISTKCHLTTESGNKSTLPLFTFKDSVMLIFPVNNYFETIFNLKCYSPTSLPAILDAGWAPPNIANWTWKNTGISIKF